MLVLVVLLSVGACDEEQPAESGHDAGVDGSVDAGLRCDALEAEWHAFVSAHQSCTQSADCRTVNHYVTAGTSGWSCDRQNGLLAALQVDALDQAEPFVDRYTQCFNADGFSEPWTDHDWDSAPPDSPYCADNQCMLSSPPCGGFTDDAGF